MPENTYLGEVCNPLSLSCSCPCKTMTSDSLRIPEGLDAICMWSSSDCELSMSDILGIAIPSVSHNHTMLSILWAWQPDVLLGPKYHLPMYKYVSSSYVPTTQKCLGCMKCTVPGTSALSHYFIIKFLATQKCLAWVHVHVGFWFHHGDRSWCLRSALSHSLIPRSTQKAWEWGCTLTCITIAELRGLGPPLG